MGRNGRNHYPWLIWLAKLLYGNGLLKRKQISLEGLERLDGLDGGFLVISNHVTTLDPVLISAALPYHIRWVAGHYLFKFKILGPILKHLATAIPKQQGQADYAALKAIQKAIKAKDVVGVFPEGTRTWDGDSNVKDSLTVAKMCKLFQAPLCIINLEGGYAQRPRWADKERKGSVIVRIVDLVDPSQMSLEDLSARIEEKLYFSSDRWLKKTGVSFESPEKAEFVERMLYMCPKCQSLCSIESHKDSIRCTKCNASGLLDSSYLLKGDFGFESLVDWHRWETENIKGIDGFSKEHGVLLRQMVNDRIRTISQDVCVWADRTALHVLDNTAARQYSFDWDKVSAFVINAKQTMELIYDHVVFRLRLEPKASALKYMEFYDSIKRN